MSQTLDLSVVIPIFNEEENLPELEKRLRGTLEAAGLDYEVLFVNDGSEDGSLAILSGLRERDARIKILDFSRNFGHQTAITAGIDHSRGEAVVVMDGDLQDPPEVLPQMVARWRAGAEVVYAVRRGRKEGWFLRLAYAFFYRLINWISEIELPLDSGDFSLMDRKVVDMVVSLPERNRYVRGLRAWVGFRQTSLEYERSARHAGKAKYDFRGLLKLALDGIFAFSDAPLRVATNLGLIITGLTAVLGIWYAIARLVGYQVVPGFATLAILVIFFGGVQLVTIGILGEYLARVYTEVKGRPRYVLRGLHGVEPTPQRHGLPPETADSGG